MRKERTHYTAEEKVAILRRHLLDKVPVSDLCEELVGMEYDFRGAACREKSACSYEPDFPIADRNEIS